MIQSKAVIVPALIEKIPTQNPEAYDYFLKGMDPFQWETREGWEKAIPLLEKALTIIPGDEEIRMHLAEAYAGTNEHEQACRQLEEILEVSPDSARAVRALGLIHSRRQDYERAIECLEKAVELDPDHAQSFYRLGAAYDNRKLYDRAVESFKSAQ